MLVRTHTPGRVDALAASATVLRGVGTSYQKLDPYTGRLWGSTWWYEIHGYLAGVVVIVTIHVRHRLILRGDVKPELHAHHRHYSAA